MTYMQKYKKYMNYLPFKAKFCIPFVIFNI